MGCDATNKEAVEKIISIKGREANKSLIILVSDIKMLENYVEFIPKQALNLINNTKTPLTIIYPKSKHLPSILSQDGTIAIRIPKHDYCQKLIQCFGKPIVSTSANISNQPSPKSFKEISEEIKNKVDFIAEIEQEKENSTPSCIYKITINNDIIKIR